MERISARVIELQDPDPSDGQRQATRPVVLIKNIHPAVGPVYEQTVTASKNVGGTNPLHLESVEESTRNKQSDAEDKLVVLNSSEVSEQDLYYAEKVLSNTASLKAETMHIAPEDSPSNVYTVYLGPDASIEKKVAADFSVIHDQNVGGKSNTDQKTVSFIQKRSPNLSERVQSNSTVEEIADRVNTKKSPVIMFKWGTTVKPFRCQICDMSFANGNFLRLHMEKHACTSAEPVKPFPCKFCTKSFQSLRSLERHQFIHSGQSQKRCKYCYKVFANKENLDKHVELHASNIKKESSNEVSSNTEVSENPSIIKHFFKCEICDKTFNRKGTLDRHLHTHNMYQKNKHQCVECGKSFLFLFALKRHVRSVHGEEPDGKECEICGKFIKNRENISRHMQIHEGVRPFACPSCGRKFTQKQHLVDHLVIHTNSLPFDCKFCGLSFRYKRSLNRHLKKHYKLHSDGQKLECIQCAGLFMNEIELIKHIEKVHLSVKHSTRVETRAKRVAHAHKATETDPVAMETVDDSEVTDYHGNQEDAKIVNEINIQSQGEEETFNNSSGAIANYRNDATVGNDIIVQYGTDGVGANEDFEVINDENDVIYTTNDSGSLGNGEEVIYILYDNGQEIVQKIIEHKGAAQPVETGTKTNDTIEATAYALDGTQLIQIGENEQVDTTAEMVELIESTENENKVIEIAEGNTDLQVYQTDGSVVDVKYSHLLKQVENVEDVDSFVDETKFVTDRSELIQSVLDYAEKIQEEELSMSNHGNCETKI